MHTFFQGRSLRFVFIGPAAIDEGLLLAKIGIEKKAAFYLLRDARMATAFGYLNDGVASSSMASAADHRCSHFWDTMQFIDQISQISLDLRNVPVIYREVRIDVAPFYVFFFLFFLWDLNLGNRSLFVYLLIMCMKRVLQENLAEMNRRVRRRMITKGRINLDVEDGCGPFDRPLLSDISMDMLRYSIHFPMQPKVRSFTHTFLCSQNRHEVSNNYHDPPIHCFTSAGDGHAENQLLTPAWFPIMVVVELFEC